MRKAFVAAVLLSAVGSLAVTTDAGAAFRLEYIEGVEPTDGMRVVAEPTYYHHPEAKASVRVDLAPVKNANDSTNKFVDPWGCEADHAQDVSPSGTYWGKYQFDFSTWLAHGGSASEYGSAPEATQDAVASRVKYDAWPNC